MAKKTENLTVEEALDKVYEVKEHMKNYARIMVPHSLVGKHVKLSLVEVSYKIVS